MKHLIYIIAALAMGTGVAFSQTPTAPPEVLFTSEKAAATQDASYGLASIYEDTQTASGEKFDAFELTAAHRTLAFGTRVLVTAIATGRSVTVRINDRGPFVPGRVVDVTHSAAKALGIVEKGVAQVRLDVVQ
jgi:peptidoglycan lytic transglycosylase